MARTKGAKDLKPRKRPGQPVNEFMPVTGTLDERVDRLLMVPERQDEQRDEPETVQQFAASVLADPAYRQSVRDRAKSGRLLPAEARMLVEFGKLATPENKTNREPWTKYATGEEVRTVSRIMACIIGRRDGKQRPDDRARRYERPNMNGDLIVSWQ